MLLLINLSNIRRKTTLEDLSVELFYDIFSYFQFHEVLKIFSNVSSRFAAIVNKMPFISVSLGLNGMDVAVSEVYITHFCQNWTYVIVLHLLLAMDYG